MSEIDVLSLHSRRDDYSCECGWAATAAQNRIDARRMHAEHVVSVLSERGYSIVELPKASAAHVMQSGLRYQAWNNTPADAPVVAWEDGEVSVDCHLGGLSKEGATDLGLALLAAAAAAEEDK